MISLAPPSSRPAQSRQPATEGASPAQTAGRWGGYGLPFWMAYVANLLVMVAIALLYRYADFVTLLGGTEFHLGWIVGVGTVGSLLMRVFLGTGIDCYGPRRIWLGSLVVFAAVCFAHVAIVRYDGLAIYFLRIVFCLAIAGVFGSSMTFISGRVPAVRVAELVGMLGTSGFAGMVLGTQLGDLLCGTHSLQRWQVDRMFVAAGLLGTCAALFAALATRGLAPPRPRRRRPPITWLLRRYQPGTVLLVGASTGAAIGLPATFLRTYAAELGIARIGLFFAVYAVTAIITRVLTRRLPQRIGLPPIILLGIAILVVGQLLFLGVRSEVQFVVPAVACGIAHAILFPAVVGASAGTFPVRYRGMAMMVVLSMYDLGQLVGAPTAGAILHYSASAGLPSYPTLFVATAAMLAVVGLVYGLTRRRGQRPDSLAPQTHTRRRAALVSEAAAAEVTTPA